MYGNGMQRKIVKQVDTVDTSTGEVIDSTQQVYTKEIEDDYIKVYVNTISSLHNVKGAAASTMFEMLSLLGYDNRIVLAPSIKKQMAENAGLKLNTLEHNLGTLRKAGLLVKEATNVYSVNPHFAGRGKWKAIKEERLAIPLNLLFTEKGVQFK